MIIGLETVAASAFNTFEQAIIDQAQLRHQIGTICESSPPNRQRRALRKLPANERFESLAQSVNHHKA